MSVIVPPKPIFPTSRKQEKRQEEAERKDGISLSPTDLGALSDFLLATAIQRVAATTEETQTKIPQLVENLRQGADERENKKEERQAKMGDCNDNEKENHKSPKKTRLAAGAGSAPAAVMSAPDAAMSAPDPAMSAPDTAMSAPDAAMSAPDAAMSAPDAAMSAPDAAMSAPDAATSAPDSVMSASPAVMGASRGFDKRSRGSHRRTRGRHQRSQGSHQRFKGSISANAEIGTTSAVKCKSSSTSDLADEEEGPAPISGAAVGENVIVSPRNGDTETGGANVRRVSDGEVECIGTVHLGSTPSFIHASQRGQAHNVSAVKRLEKEERGKKNGNISRMAPSGRSYNDDQEEEMTPPPNPSFSPATAAAIQNGNISPILTKSSEVQLVRRTSDEVEFLGTVHLPPGVHCQVAPRPSIAHASHSGQPHNVAAVAGATPGMFGGQKLGAAPGFYDHSINLPDWTRASPDNGPKEARLDAKTPGEDRPEEAPSTTAQAPAAAATPAAAVATSPRGTAQKERMVRKRKLGETSPKQPPCETWIRPQHERVVTPAKFEVLRQQTPKTAGRGRSPIADPGAVTTSSTCLGARLLVLPPNLNAGKKNKVDPKPHSFLLSVHTSTIPNAGRGLFLTYLGPCKVMKLNEYVDLGRYGPHRAQDIKKDYLMMIKNFIFNDSPNEWSFDGPPPLLDASLPPRQLFGEVVDEHVMFDITSDETGCVHDIARKTLLPFVNEVSVHKENKVKTSKGVQNVDAFHHDDGSLHYVLRRQSSFRLGVTTELLVYYGSEYQDIQNRKAVCYDQQVPQAVSRGSAPNCDMSDLSRCISVAAARHNDDNDEEDDDAGSVGSSYQPYFTMRKAVFTLLEKDISKILDMFLKSPPIPSASRQRMHWLVQQIMTYAQQCLYPLGEAPHHITKRMLQALHMFPRPEGDPHREEDVRYYESFQYVGRSVRKANRRSGYITGMVEGIVGWSLQNHAPQPKPGERQYLVVHFSGEGEEIMSEHEVRTGLMPNIFGMMG